MNRSIPAILQFLIDIACVVLALIIAYWLRIKFQRFDFETYQPLILASILSYTLAFLLSGCYREYLRVPLRGHLHNGLRAFLIGCFILLTSVYLFRLGYFARALIIIYWIILLIFLLISRISIFSIVSNIAGKFKTMKVKIISDCEEKEDLNHLLESNHLIGYELTEDNPDGYMIIGSLDDCKKYRDDKRKIRFVPKNFLQMMKDAPLYDLPGVWIPGKPNNPWLKVKKLWDFIFSYPITLLLTIVSLPLFPVFSFLIKRDSPGEVFFKQRRYTKNMKPFTLFKFRTMIKGAERIKIDDELDDDPRVTRFGSFLRRTSLDELPQLVNVLRHDMNLVGPRPLIKKEVYRYRFIQQKRLKVRAGLTGLVQISGRKTYSLEEMTILDLYYVEHWSPLFDLELLFLTIPSILIGKGAY